MFIIALGYALIAATLLTLCVALLAALTGIYAATQAPEYAGRLTHWLGYGKEHYASRHHHHRG